MRGRQVARSWTAAMLAVVVLGQLSVAGAAIWRHERTLREGALVALKVEPADPVDPFRGRYLVLRYAAERVSLDAPPPEADPVYAHLATGRGGYARVTAVSAEPPATGVYVRARIAQRVTLDDRLWLRFPFDRYYVEESLAPEMERQLRQLLVAGGDGGPEVYARVRILDGHGVLVGLFVAGEATARDSADTRDEATDISLETFARQRAR